MICRIRLTHPKQPSLAIVLEMSGSDEAEDFRWREVVAPGGHEMLALTAGPGFIHLPSGVWELRKPLQTGENGVIVRLATRPQARFGQLADVGLGPVPGFRESAWFKGPTKGWVWATEE